jgi:hypothetical protein
MHNVRPAAAAFSTIVTNLVNTFETSEDNTWTSFMAGSAPLDVTVTQGRMYIYLEDGTAHADVDQRPVCIEAVAVVPNTDQHDPAQWDVIGDQMHEGRRVVLASFKGLDFALCFALERVCARNWYAGAQDQHDPVAV